MKYPLLNVECWNLTPNLKIPNFRKATKVVKPTEAEGKKLFKKTKKKQILRNLNLNEELVLKCA